MGKSNNFMVAISNSSGFSPVSKKTIFATSILSDFSNSVTQTFSQRNELLSAKQDGLFPETAYNLRALVCS
jgi:hypothetical protein